MVRKSDMPYYGTEVPVSKSQESIRKMLLGNGAIGYQFTEMPEQEMVEIKWARKVVIQQGANKKEMVQPCRMRITYKGKRIEQVYRALYYHMKAKFEIIRFGIMSYEEEFLPYFEMMIDGRPTTIAEMCLPGLMKGLPPHLEPFKLPENTEDRK